MSLLKFLGLAGSEREPSNRSSFVEAVRRRLAYMPAHRAEFVAAFAGLLVRVAYADLDISAAERDRLRGLIAERAGLAQEESAMVADIATQQATALGGIDYALLTRTFNDIASREEKEQLIDCLYAIATAQSSVSVVEDEEIRAVARALLLSHQQFINVRHRYKEQLEVIQEVRKLRRP